jgi:hypothetical protein
MAHLNGDDPDDEPTQDEIDRYELESILNDAAAQFDQLCVDRHEVDMRENGALAFLSEDVVKSMLEELADTTNFCRQQGIKLMILQSRLEQQLGAEHVATESGEIELGFQAFKGTKDTGWSR